VADETTRETRQAAAEFYYQASGISVYVHDWITGFAPEDSPSTDRDVRELAVLLASRERAAYQRGVEDAASEIDEWRKMLGEKLSALRIHSGKAEQNLLRSVAEDVRALAAQKGGT